MTSFLSTCQRLFFKAVYIRIIRYRYNKARRLLLLCLEVSKQVEGALRETRHVLAARRI